MNNAVKLEVNNDDILVEPESNIEITISDIIEIEVS